MKMRFNTGPAALFLGAALVVTAAHRDTARADNLPDSVRDLPTAIHDVATGGFWSQGDDAGIFRAIVVSAGTEHVRHRLFLQMIQFANGSGQPAVRNTVPITGLGTEDAEGAVLKIEIEPDPAIALKLVIQASAPRSGAVRRYLFTASGPGGGTALKRLQ